MDKRIAYIDTAKGVTILLVIIGHCAWIKSVPGLDHLIYSFHIPLFFIVSGMFTKKSRQPVWGGGKKECLKFTCSLCGYCHNNLSYMPDKSI